MVFSSLIFLYFFLPLSLIFYFLFKDIRIKNFILLVFSFVFYAWGEPVWIILLLFSGLLDYANGFLIEKYRRTSIPYATFVLTIIGVSMSSKKVRGGIGVQLGFGILLSFTYIMFMQISQTFATNGSLPPLLAVWLPNLLYTVIALYLLRKAMK